MHASFTSTLLLATGALASPLTTIPRRADPSTTTAKAFTLVANITSPSTSDTSVALFGASVQYWSLIGVHVGAGLNTAVLDNITADVFVQNSTTQGLSFVAPLSQYPYGFTISELDALNQDAGLGADESEFYIGEDIGYGTPGVNVATPPNYPKAVINVTESATEGVAGSFVVCNETTPAYGLPQYPVRFVSETSPGGLVVPTECVAISLLAQCADLPALPEGAVYNYDSVQEVPCYEDVKSIDWRQAS